MDKKNMIIGVALLIAAFASMMLTPKATPPPAAPTTATQSTPASATTRASTPTYTDANTLASRSTPRSTEISAVKRDIVGAKVNYLANNFVEIRLSNYGGAIKEVALRKFAETLDSHQRFTLNNENIEQMLGIMGLPGLGEETAYEIVSQSSREVVYRAVFENRIEVTRRYALADPSRSDTDPYQIRHETTFRNLTDQTLPLPKISLSLGTVSPINDTIYGQQHNSGYFDGEDAHFIEYTDLKGGGIMSFVGIGSREPVPVLTKTGSINWATLSNQFFTSVLTPDQPGTALITRRVPVKPFESTPESANFGLSAETQFDLDSLPPGGAVILGMRYYIGPKEYKRLSNGDIFTQDQDEVMNFGFFGIFSEILLTTMTWVHNWMDPFSPTWSWGWAVVITTLILKIVFLPLTLIAAKSGKRMQKIQPEMKEMREKYKDNPQKMQAATMELFKKHRVNPMGGCIPILLTMPFFFGFFIMLRSAAELRFEPFLWSADLAAPDTVGHIMGLPINILPLLMGATMIYQMKLTPQPTVDNAQAKIFKFMPWMFTLICYNFSGALALYSTVNGLFTIGQQLVINRMKDDPLPPAPVATKGNKKVKNVTPKKRK